MKPLHTFAINDIRSQKRISFRKSLSKKTVKLNGNTLALTDLEPLAEGARVEIAKPSLKKITASREIVETALHGETPVYAINTGFGFFANTKIDFIELEKLQRNILLSHAGGVGKLLSDQEVRLALALRLNVLVKGRTGVTVELCTALQKLVNSGIIPLVPEFGSVGASGDLIPLSHLTLPLIGEGFVRYRGKIIKSAQALKLAGLRPYKLAAKEGLSLVNGTQIMLAIGSLGFLESVRLLELAGKIAALSAEALNGRASAFTDEIHTARGQEGQIAVAALMRRELTGSAMMKKGYSPARVQDPYSIRCAPQIHGPSLDAFRYVAGVLTRELNAATDNPLVFRENGSIISGGNFHGQALAMAFDFATIAAAELGNVSERRLELLCNPHMSGLPALLAKDGGVNSGYMVLQYLAASIVNENKKHAVPSVTDSIPGNVGIEDHVSMGMASAKAMRAVAENLKAILAAELLAACQGLDLRGLKPTGKGTAATYHALRKRVPTLEKDRFVSEDVRLAIEVVDELLLQCTTIRLV